LEVIATRLTTDDVRLLQI